MTGTAIGLLRESRSYSPCATHAREDRPARRTLPFFSICFQKLAKRRARSVNRLHAQVISTVVESVFPVSLPPPAWAGQRRAGLRRAVTGARPGFGTRPAARLRRTRPGRASPCDRRPGSGTRQGFGAHDRARFRHAACSTDPL